ncbi:alpha/beta fold hydrolase [Croceicoccus sediminis]|uniref:alpha/beta fold hydrolase n=1 Tax=Croceicoccus sediminis TaxID=2571150 RepID=UPI0011821432|nr:alpha/beta hydrolase [Croceicoccus sediminis]
MTGEKAATKSWRDSFWRSEDGLELHYRDYPGPEGSRAIPALCIPGLSRNARDFHDLALHLAHDRRVIVVDLRGRGDSEYAKVGSTYNPLQYAQDLQRLFVLADLDRAVFIGSSLGGLVTMILAMLDPARIAAAILNDIGPVIGRAGLERISGYVGQGRSYPTWMHAAWALQDMHQDTYPDWKLEDWLAEAKRAMELGNNGRITFDYDMRVAETFQQGLADAAETEIWNGFDALKGKPVLILRGEHSDILTGATARDMVSRFDGVELVTVPRVGHLPTLSEPAAVEAIDRLFDERLPLAIKAGPGDQG